MPTRSRRTRELLVAALAGAETIDDVLESAGDVLRPALGAAGAGWSTLDPASLLGTTCVVIADLGFGAFHLPHEPERERRMFQIEWDDTEPNTFASLVRSARSAAALRQDVGDLATVPRAAELMEPMGATDELRMMFPVDGRYWGSAVMYRMGDPEPFSADDVATAESCAPVIGQALRRAMLNQALTRPDVPEPPGSLLLGADDRVLVTSAAAEALLGTLGEDHARVALTTLAIGARREASLSTRVTGAEGTLMLHASPAKGLDGAISVVVERPRPIELAPLIVDALGFTPRERVVAELVLQGFDRAQIAHQLELSRHTVGDVVKSIYAKAGVHRRAELCALIFGDHFQPRLDEAALPSPYGYFLDPIARPAPGGPQTPR